MYKVLLDKNWIRNFFISIGYSIGIPSKLYEYNQSTIKIVLVDIINPQSRPLDVLVNDLHEIHLRKIFETVDTRSNMQLDDLNSNPRGGKSLRDIIDRAILDRLYPPTVS